MRDKKFLMVASIIVIVSLMMVGIGIHTFQNSPFFYLRGQNKKPIYFGATYMTMNNPYFAVINDEIEKEVKQHGDILYTMDPALSVEKQIDQIHYLIDKGIQVLFVNPVAIDSLHDVLEECRKKEILVIAVDTNLNENDYVSYTVVSDNYNAGVLAAKDMMQQKSSARIVLLEHSQTASGSQRIQGFVDTIQGKEEYQIVARKECEGQLEIATPKMLEMIASGIDFDVVMALNDPSALGAMAAMQNQGVEDVLVYGVDGSPDGKVLIKDGKLQGSAAQSPIQIGKEAVKVAYSMLDGKPVETTIKKIPVTLITKENVSQFSLKGWQ